MNATPVDGMYRDTGIGVFADHPDGDLMETTEKLAGLPLLAQPGAEWNYSVATDVLGALVQAISGQRFGAFLEHRILGPLGMEDTDFRVPANKMDRLAAIYRRDPEGGLCPAAIWANTASRANEGWNQVVAGLSTVGDYLTFCDMLLNKGVHGGVRLLGRKTVELMTTNQR